MKNSRLELANEDHKQQVSTDERTLKQRHDEADKERSLRESVPANNERP